MAKKDCGCPDLNIDCNDPTNDCGYLANRLLNLKNKSKSSLSSHEQKDALKKIKEYNCCCKKQEGC